MGQYTVRWADITAECGSYKAGFIAVFRRHEGEPTDEKDPQGRTVKVSQNSFADHVGIPRATFKDWVKRAAAVQPPARRRSQDVASIRGAARRDPDAVVDAVMELPESTRDHIFHEVKLRRAGIDTSPSNRKAAEAFGHKAAEPYRRFGAAVGLVTVVPALEQATEGLARAISEEVLTAEAMDQIAEAFEAFSLTLAEARFAVSS